MVLAGTHNMHKPYQQLELGLITDTRARLKALEIARTWIGTPYHHQARVKGHGCDCIGLIIGVWEELYGAIPKSFIMPAYTPSWSEETGLSLMAEVGKTYLISIPKGGELPGDILMYRMLYAGPTKHAGLMSGPETMIHAYSGHDVLETSLVSNFGSELTHVFRYPDNPRLT